MPATPDLRVYLERTERYLNEKLIPFWATRAVEPQFGGFNPNYDRDGKFTGVSEKAMLTQARGLFTLAHTGRLGFHYPGWRAHTAQAADFLRLHFHDGKHDGHYWMTTADGQLVDDQKVIYGHSFIVYAHAEHALATGDTRSRAVAERTFALLLDKAADLQYGGFFEHFDRAWNPVIVRADGIRHKSMDVHMHLLEAFTTLYELTRAPRHREVLEQVAELIFTRMVHQPSGLGMAMFRPDLTPISNIALGTLWGRDRFPQPKAPEITSYGHNIELAWLYDHMQQVLGRDPASYLHRLEPIFRHTLERGVDWEEGGLFTEGPRDGAPTETNKEFWQQAEAMVGFLCAYRLTRDERYLQAFAQVHDFVFAKMINWEVGEWYPLLDRHGVVLWDYMGYHWKICYHTLRAVGQVVVRLRALLAAG